MKRKHIFLAVAICVVLALVIGLAVACNKTADKDDDSSKNSSSVAEVMAQDELNDADENNSNDSDKDESDIKKASSGSDKDESNLNGSGDGSENVTSDNNGSTQNGQSDGGSDTASGDGSSADKKGSSSTNKNNSGSSNDKTSDDSSKTSGNKNNGTASSDSQSSGGNKTNVTLTGNEKTFVITLYPDLAPKTCSNFQKLVDEGFYNGLTFNRVINNFMAQAGDTKGDGTGGSDTKISGEFSSNGVENELSHQTGVVSMYRDPSDPNSATSQFFICYNDNCKFMDGNYAAFGKVTDGFSVVQDFQNVERETGYDGTKSKPVTPITIVLAESAGKDSDGNPKIKFYVTY